MEKTPTKPRKRPRQARSRALVDAIVEGTSRVLCRDGYAGLTTTAVAEVTGVSIGSLYQYFPSREALVAEVLRRHARGTITRIDGTLAIHADQPTAIRMRHLLEELVAIKRENPKLHRVFATEIPDLPGFRAKHRVLAHCHSLLLGQLRAEGHAASEAQVFAALHAVEGVLAGAARSRRRLADPDLVDTLMRLMLLALDDPKSGS